MKILWDEHKRVVNLERHGMDFADLDETFFERSAIAPAKLGRLIAVGRLRSGVIVVVFVELGTEAVSVISMRPASRKERRGIDG
ncbi:BrnT family toxin [Rhodopseudomonas palustris]|uniref:BrnT family toxin n=1 Tax=Rhodopseudomonas palustris TaxID=1076 RepID=UPI002ACE0723|nr:BrnT family toxin [Rhodopseudomonas palustris]WQH00138.1 BrnT family toxin [Rhodopseudomonas palustris]